MGNLKFLFLILVMFTFSCQEEQKTVELDNNEIAKSTSRGVNMVQIEFHQNELNDEDQVTQIYRSLISAEKEVMQLDVNFVASNEAEKGFFVFKMESSDQKNLTLELYDEEGFELAGSNTLSILEGNNYRALNVTSLDNGSYILKLSDESGAELQHQFSVK